MPWWRGGQWIAGEHWGGLAVIVTVHCNSRSQAGHGDSTCDQDSEAEAGRHGFEASLDGILEHDLVL